jgi:hypothetical protein
MSRRALAVLLIVLLLVVAAVPLAISLSDSSSGVGSSFGPVGVLSEDSGRDEIVYHGFCVLFFVSKGSKSWRSNIRYC